MSNIVSFKGANLPAVATLSTSLRSLQSEVGSGDVIIKMDKTGCWVYGADAVEVEEGSHWAINPFSFLHGYVAWGEGEKLGELMVPVSQPLPELPPSPTGAKRGWEMQVGFQMQCLDGEDEGLQCRFAVSSVGGKRAVQAMGTDIAIQVDKEAVAGEKAKIIPVVTLGSDHYQHKQYGKIYTPVFTVKEWVPMTATAPAPGEDSAPGTAPAASTGGAPAETPAPEGGRRRRRAAQ